MIIPPKTPKWHRPTRDPLWMRCRWDYVGQPATLIHARAWSTGKNSQVPAIDLVHGIGVSSRYMIPTGQSLAGHHAVYAFIGVDTERFPSGFSVFVRIQSELQLLRPIFPRPAPMHPNDAIAFLAENAERNEVEVIDAR